MNSKFFLAALAATVVIFLSGWVIYGMLLMDYMNENSTMNTEPEMWAIVAGNLCMGILFTYICQVAGYRTFMRGLTNGLLLGILMFLSGDFIAYGSGVFKSVTAMLADVAAGAIMGALAGGIAAWVLGSGNAAPASAAPEEA